MSFIKYSSTTGAVNLSFAAMWIVIAVLLLPTAAFVFYAEMPWLGLIVLALAAFCVWPFRLCLRDGRAELQAYRADLADRAARRNA
jgi:hypothetical protein